MLTSIYFIFLFIIYIVVKKQFIGVKNRNDNFTCVCVLYFFVIRIWKQSFQLNVVWDVRNIWKVLVSFGMGYDWHFDVHVQVPHTSLKCEVRDINRQTRRDGLESSRLPTLYVISLDRPIYSFASSTCHHFHSLKFMI